MPVASGVRLRAGGHAGSPPAIGPPLRSAPWHPRHTEARCLPNSVETVAAGGTATCGLLWLGMTEADILNWPVATRIFPSGPNAGAATVLFTGGSDRM